MGKWGFMDQNIFTGNEKGIIQKWDQRMCPTGNTEEVGEAIYSWKAHDNKITTSASSGHFETYLYNIITEEKIGMFKGHFSTINTVAFHPKGHQITTGGEEGNARINNLDRNYLEYKEPEMELVMENPEYMPVESY